MNRTVILSIAVASLFAWTGCEKQATNVPEPEEKSDGAPPEEELDGAGMEEEEEAPNLGRRRLGEDV